MSQKNHLEQIEAYLDGSMSPEERQDFESRLKTDNALAEAFAAAQSATDALDILVQIQLKKQLKTMEKQRSQKNKFSIRKNIIPLAAAIILGVLTIAWFGIRSTYSDSSLVAAAMETYPGTGIRGSAEIDQGVQAYSEKNYASAMEYFEGITKGDPYYSTAQFYLGNIYLENGLSSKAIRAFEIVRDNNDSRFAEPSEWFLALSYLSSGQRNSAKEELGKVARNAQHAYKEQAEKLLSKMGSPMRSLPGI
ncbi:MAG: hypothetical protein AAF502_02530 [Bacteroidota bacterium]